MATKINLTPSNVGVPLIKKTTPTPVVNPFNIGTGAGTFKATPVDKNMLNAQPKLQPLTTQNTPIEKTNSNVNTNIQPLKETPKKTDFQASNIVNGIDLGIQKEGAKPLGQQDNTNNNPVDISSLGTPNEGATTLGQKTPEQLQAEADAKKRASPTPTIDALTAEQKDIQDKAAAGIATQETLLADSQKGLQDVQKEFQSTLAAYKKEYENQLIMERMKVQKTNEDDLLKARQDLDKELASLGISNYNTEQMNASTRQKYNAFTAKEAAITAHNSLLNNNLTTATSVIDKYYDNQSQYLRDQANNLNNILSSSSGELNRLTGVQKDAIANKLNLLSSEIAIEEKKKENVQEMKNDIDGFTRAMKDEGLSLTDSVDTQLAKYNKAVKTQSTIDDLSGKYRDANILPTDTLAQARMKLMLSPSFITNFGAGVDIVTNSKTGEILAYNKINGKYSTISQGLSSEQLNALDAKDTIDYTLKLQDQFKANTKDISTILTNADMFDSAYEQMLNAAQNGTSLSPSQSAQIITVNKILDPTSVVREGEYNRVTAQQSTWDSMITLKNKILTGGVITQDEAKAYKELVDKIQQANLNKFAASMDTTLNSIGTIGLDPSTIFDSTDITRYKQAKYSTPAALLADYPELITAMTKICESNTKISDNEKLETLIYLSGSKLSGFNNVGSDTKSATSGSIAERTNNPGNIKWTGAKWQTDLGGVDSGIKATDGGTFVKFPSLDKGQNAQKSLLTAPSYANLTFDAAMKRWSNNGYGADLVKQLPANKLMKDMKPQELQYIINAMSARESGNKNFSQI